jgi:hypothetical protein
MHKKFWSENLKGRNHSEDLGVDGMSNIRTNLREIMREGVARMQLVQD